MSRAALTALALLALVAPPAGAADGVPPQPTIASAAYSQQALTAKLLVRIEADYEKQRGSRHGRFRAVYPVAHGLVERSELDETWTSAWRFEPMPLAQAIALAREYQRLSGEPAKSPTAVDWAKPLERKAGRVVYGSPQEGCSQAFAFELDGDGRCVAIVHTGGC